MTGEAAVIDVQGKLDALDRASSPAAYLQVARELRELPVQGPPVAVAVLSSFTLDQLRPYLEVELVRQRLAPRLYFAPFNTAARELFDPGSTIAQTRTDVVFVAQALADLAPSLVFEFLALTAKESEVLCDQVVESLASMLGAFRSHSAATVVVHNFALPAEPALGIADLAAERSQTRVVRELNARLVERLATIPGCVVLDFERVVAGAGYAHAFDDKLWYLGRAPLSAQALPELARVQAAFVQAILGRQAKCLVLDLDNTLWGGVVGEAGVNGIQIGDTYPGNAFRDFQRTLLTLRARGVLLALNSKNNPQDVEDVFTSHPQMLLRREHFAAVRINWRDKPENMRALAQELNIGLDALVFFDDNPAERMLMREALPEVRTLEVPADPLHFTRALNRSRAFDRLSYTAEDRQRAEIYRAQAERQQQASTATSLEGYLAGLEMRVDIRRAGEAALPRVLDLVQKTNQFNLTTRRHSAADVARLQQDETCAIFTMRVADRFGDQGVVGVAIVRQTEKEATLDTLLLSCRVIGRNVETALLFDVVDWLRERRATILRGEFITTGRNAPAADFFERHGFTRVAGDATCSQWESTLEPSPVTWPAYIARF